MGVDCSEILFLMEGTLLLYKCTYCVFTVYGLKPHGVSSLLYNLGKKNISLIMKQVEISSSKHPKMKRCNKDFWQIPWINRYHFDSLPIKDEINVMFLILNLQVNHFNSKI